MSEPMILVHEDSLAHYGVKGMRWGKSSGGSDGSPKPPSKSKQRTNAIKEARSNLSDVGRKAINAEEKYHSAKTDRSRKIAQKALEKAGDEYMVTLARSMQRTRGEKIANGIAVTVAVSAVLSAPVAGLARR